MIPSNNSYYTSTSSPHRLSHHHPRVCNDCLGAGGETPLSETRWRGIRRAVVRSPGVAVVRRAQARPPSPGPRPCPGRRHFCPPLPPACAEPRPPRLVPSSLDTCPPHPCQGFREPSRPLPCLPPTATTMPTTSAALKPRWTHFLRMTGRGPPSPRFRCPHLPECAGVGRGGAQNTLSLPGSRSRLVRCLRTIIPCRHRHRRGGIARSGGFQAQRQRWNRQRRW